MITLDSYLGYLGSKGNHLGEIRKNKSDDIMNATFKGDVGYKRVYILDPKKGWHYEDCKYSKHATYSILRDTVDYYIQFRPNVHYPLGMYLFIPDDTSSEIGFSVHEPKNPFADENFDFNKLWMIVGRNNSKQFVRYNILPCDWNLQWVCKYNGKRQVLNCWCSLRSQNSYTAGSWWAERSAQLDQVTGLWLPDIYQVYGDKLSEYHLCDTRYLAHDQRYMITNNIINPKVYMCTKVEEMNPQGIIKLTVKQDEFDRNRDNVELLICDYYNDSGDVYIDEPEEQQSETKTSIIHRMVVNSDGELIENDGTYPTSLVVGKISYYEVVFSDEGIKPDWRVSLIDNDGEYTEDEKAYYENLLVLTKYDDSTLAIRVGKANSLKGKHFLLSVQDNEGYYKSFIELEVAE